MEAQPDTSEIVLYFVRSLPRNHPLHFYCERERTSYNFKTWQRAFSRSPPLAPEVSMRKDSARLAELEV